MQLRLQVKTPHTCDIRENNVVPWMWFLSGTVVDARARQYNGNTTGMQSTWAAQTASWGNEDKLLSMSRKLMPEAVECCSRINSATRSRLMSESCLASNIVQFSGAGCSDITQGFNMQLVRFIYQEKYCNNQVVFSVWKTNDPTVYLISNCGSLYIYEIQSQYLYSLLSVGKKVFSIMLELIYLMYKLKYY